jgi:hypothetical protein
VRNAKRLRTEYSRKPRIMARVEGDEAARPAQVSIALIRSLSVRISSLQISKSSFAAYAVVPIHAVLVTISAVVAVAAATAAAVGVVGAAVAAVAAGPVLG